MIISDVTNLIKKCYSSSNDSMGTQVFSQISEDLKNNGLQNLLKDFYGYFDVATIDAGSIVQINTSNVLTPGYWFMSICCSLDMLSDASVALYTVLDNTPDYYDKVFISAVSGILPISLNFILPITEEKTIAIRLQEFDENSDIDFTDLNYSFIRIS